MLNGIETKLKSLTLSFGKKVCVSVLFSAFSWVILFYSPLLAHLLKNKLESTGIQVQQISGNLSSGFVLEKINSQQPQLKISIRKIEFKISEFLSLFYDQKLVIEKLNLDGITIVSNQITANELTIAFLTHLSSDSVGNNQASTFNEIDLRKVEIKIDELPNVKLKKPIEVAVKAQFKKNKLHHLQLNAFSNQLVLTAERESPFQLWLVNFVPEDTFASSSSQSINHYSKKLNAIEFVSSDSVIAELLFGVPQTRDRVPALNSEDSDRNLHH